MIQANGLKRTRQKMVAARLTPAQSSTNLHKDRRCCVLGMSEELAHKQIVRAIGQRPFSFGHTLPHQPVVGESQAVNTFERIGRYTQAVGVDVLQIHFNALIRTVSIILSQTRSF